MTQGPSFATKKGTLLALACAAAFAVPQAADAQRAKFDVLKADGHPLTLQGAISAGYARHKTTGSAGGAAVDGPERGTVWSGESNIRFSASSKLNQGFIQGIGFQVESGFETTNGALPGSLSQGSLASRNTGLGLKTSAGTVFMGRWDTPIKQVTANYMVTSSSVGLGGSTTGFYGTPGFGAGSFTGPGGNASFGGTAAGGANVTMNFRRRQANTINYYSPEFAGFQVGLMYGPDEELAPTGATGGFKPTMWGGSVAYAGGPFRAQIGYEKHEDYRWGPSLTAATFNNTAGANVGAVTGGNTGINSSDHAFNVGLSYTFGPVMVNGLWERLSYSQNSNGMAGAAVVNLRDIESTKWYIGAQWNVGGPHRLIANYGRANDLSCSWVAVNNSCDDTGAQMYNFLYRYQLDRASYINVMYSGVNNDRNGNLAGSTSANNVSASTSNGHKDSGWSIGLSTTF